MKLKTLALYLLIQILSSKGQDCTDNSESYLNSNGCKIPCIQNGIVVSDNSEQEVGSIYSDVYPVSVKCFQTYSITMKDDQDNKNYCIDGGPNMARRWDKKFLKCRKICSTKVLQGKSFTSRCHKNGAVIYCNSPILVGTTATIFCNAGYKYKYQLYGETRCLENGEWSPPPQECEPICGMITPKAAGLRIVGGRDANISEVPWIAMIIIDNKQTCGGTIIATKVVISAAHCFPSRDIIREDIAKDLYKVAAGKTMSDLNADEQQEVQIESVLRINIPEKGTSANQFYERDIAVIIVKSGFEFKSHIAPACIQFTSPRSQPLNGTYGLVGGWGLNRNEKNGNILQKIKIPTVDRITCLKKAPFDYLDYVLEDKICVGFMDNFAGICGGDSGGGLVIPKTINDEEVYHLEGIVSNGRREMGDCGLNFYTLFTNIQDYRQIIEKTIEESSKE